MTPENQKMKDYLKENGVDAMPKFLWKGSMKGCWRLYKHTKEKNGHYTYVNWWNNFGLQNKLAELGFTDFRGQPLNNFSGNGGVFSIFARNNELTKRFCSLTDED
jgi:hypothetical protein